MIDDKEVEPVPPRDGVRVEVNAGVVPLEVSTPAIEFVKSVVPVNNWKGILPVLPPKIFCAVPTVALTNEVTPVPPLFSGKTLTKAGVVPSEVNTPFDAFVKEVVLAAVWNGTFPAEPLFKFVADPTEMVVKEF